MRTILHYTLLTLAVIYSFSSFSQNGEPWKVTTPISAHQDLLTGATVTGYLLDRATVKTILEPTSYRTPKGDAFKSANTLLFPSPEGTMETYKVVRTRVLSEELAEKFPGIRSYQGASQEHPGRRIYFSMDKSGFHGMIRDGGNTWYLNPTSNGSNEIYLASKTQLNPQSYECRTEGKVVSESLAKTEVQLRSPDDGNLRTFRLALACTGEYANYHINKAGVSTGTDTEKKEAVLAAMNTTMTRVNGIFENDLALTMQLIANNDEIIFLDGADDGLSNDNGSALLGEIQTVIDRIIGFNNYDIGHVFSTGGGGIARVASPCTADKAQGVTGLSVPEGDLFNIDFVAHEMGHQFGATHTFNNSCSENRTSITAVEPGSGSTIMAYAGICPPNVANQSGTYFHAISVQQMYENITEGNSTCAALTALNNTAPELIAPTNYVIPAGTPFVLEAQTTDTNNEAFTYCWEQQDNEITAQPPTSTATEGPVFRSRPPSSSPNRFFPNPEALLANNLSPEWERLPTVARDLNFSILVRDNNENGGQVSRGDLNISIVETESPFSVTSQTSGATLLAGQAETITWEVGGTNASPVNTALVDIFLIVDGDLDNPVLIEEDTPNDGNQQVVIPTGVATSNARIMVKADNNIFFALNRATLSVEQSEFALDLSSLEYSVCVPESLVIPFSYLAYSGFSETTSFTATNVSNGLDIAFSSNSASANNTELTATISNTDQATTGINSFTLVATAAGGTVREYPISLNIYSNTFDAPALQTPANNGSDIYIDAPLTWSDVSNTTSYRIEIATDEAFSNIIESGTTTLPEYFPGELNGNTLYYWRVIPVNDCSEGTPSATFSFTTIAITTAAYENNNSVQIPSSGPQTVTSEIVVDREGDLNKIIVGVNISHTYVEDLTLTLTSPNGTTITLIDQPCGENNDMDVTFDDEGNPLTCGTSPAVSGIVIPKDDLSTFRGAPIKGTWTLTVIDGFDEDGGSINSFSLEVFVNGNFKEDADGDGVFDDIDQCPNTPQGAKVDINGCTIFSLPASNYLIRTEGESCRNNEDGSIEITTERALEYTATLTGNDGFVVADFTQNYTFNNLSAGGYQLCFTVAGEAEYQQCFDIRIDEPEALSVLSKANTSAKTLELALGGADLYFIELNGTTTTTKDNSITLSLKEGINTLTVSTTKSCQGEYKEQFIIGSGLRVYPNPVGNTLHITTADRNTNIEIAIYSITGKRALSKQLTTDQGGHASTGIAELPSGVYLLEIVGASAKKTIKLIKQ